MPSSANPSRNLESPSKPPFGSVWALRMEIVRIPGGSVPDAAKARARGHVRIQHLTHRCAKREVRETHDRRAHAAGSVPAARAHGGDAVDELGLAHRPHRRRTVRPVHRPALHEDRRHDIVAAARIRQQFVQQVAAFGVVPKMVVRVADRQLGLEDILLDLRQPFFANHGVSTPRPSEWICLRASGRRRR